MSGQVGTVTAVQSERRGVIATSWVGTVLTVVNAADLDRAGGLLSPDGGQTTYAYTAVTDGASELDPDTVTMADSAPAEWPTDTTDPETGDVIPAEVRLDVWPERLDVTAMVDLGDGETIPAVVPHSLRPLLVDGVRETGAGESVQLARVAGVWTISDVPGRRAVIEGTKVVVPSASALPRTELSDDALMVLRDDGDGGAVATTVLGGDADQLQIYRPDGSLVGGIGPDGVVTGSSVQVPEVLLDGDSIRDLIDARPRGPVAVHFFTENTPEVGTTEAVPIDLQFIAEPGRLYRFFFNAGVRVLAAGRTVLRWRVSMGDPGGDSAPRPTTSSTLVQTGTYLKGTTDGTENKPFDTYWPGPNDTAVTAPTPVRVGLGMYTESSSGTINIGRNTGYISVVDEGSLYSGTMADGNLGSVPVTTQTRYFAPSWTYVWRNGSGQTGIQTPQQGYATRALGVGHPAGGWYTMVGFPDAMRSFMAGAQKISDVSLWTNSFDCMNASGFVPRLSWHAQSTNPASPVGSGDFDLRNLPKGAVRWNQLPSGAWPNIQSGAYLGLTFGLRTGQDAKYAGCFSITDGAPGAFKVTVTK